MTTIELETVQLRDCMIVRPAGRCGTMGWHPKAWTCAVVKRGQTALDAFLMANKNWMHAELSPCVLPARGM